NPVPPLSGGGSHLTIPSFNPQSILRLSDSSICIGVIGFEFLLKLEPQLFIQVPSVETIIAKSNYSFEPHLFEHGFRHVQSFLMGVPSFISVVPASPMPKYRTLFSLHKNPYAHNCFAMFGDYGETPRGSPKVMILVEKLVGLSGGLNISLEHGLNSGLG